MLFFASLLPIAGLIVIFEESSRVLKAILLCLLAGAIFYDFVKSTPRRVVARDIVRVLPIVLFHLLMSLSFLICFFVKDSLLTISAMQFVVLVLCPWAAIIMTLFRQPLTTELFGYRGSGLGLITFATASVVLAKLGFSADQTEATYGAVTQGVASNTYRTVLPGFVGILAGGAFCGLAASCAVASCAVSRNWFVKLGSGVLYLAVGYGVVLTDSRTSLAIYLLMPTIALLWWLLRTAKIGRRNAAGDTVLLGVKGGIVFLAVLPWVLPLVAPTVDELTQNAQIPILSDKMLRGRETPFSFSGRTDVWRVATSFIVEHDPIFAAVRPVGEYSAGVAEEIFALGTIPSTAEWAHCHNSVLNYYFSYGIFGLVVLLVVLIYICRHLMRAASWQQLCFILPFFAIALEMCFEALFSPAQRYFSVFLTLFMLELYRESLKDRPISRGGPRRLGHKWVSRAQPAPEVSPAMSGEVSSPSGASSDVQATESR